MGFPLEPGRETDVWAPVRFAACLAPRGSSLSAYRVTESGGEGFPYGRIAVTWGRRAEGGPSREEEGMERAHVSP